MADDGEMRRREQTQWLLLLVREHAAAGCWLRAGSGSQAGGGDRDRPRRGRRVVAEGEWWQTSGRRMAGEWQAAIDTPLTEYLVHCDIVTLCARGARSRHARLSLSPVQPCTVHP